MKRQLTITLFTLIALSLTALAQVRDQRPCQRDAGGECASAMSALRDINPRNAKIVVLSTPGRDDTINRDLREILLPVIIDHFGNSVVVLDGTYQIPNEWRGKRYTLTYKARIAYQGNKIEDQSAGQVITRKGGELLRDIFIDIAGAAIPGNNPTSNRTRQKGREAADEIGQGVLDQLGLNQPGHEQVLAVTADFIRGDGLDWIPIQPVTHYWKVASKYMINSRKVYFVLNAHGTHPQRLEKIKEINLGYTWDAIDVALNEGMFSYCIGGGIPVKRYFEGRHEGEDPRSNVASYQSNPAGDRTRQRTNQQQSVEEQPEQQPETNATGSLSQQLRKQTVRGDRYRDLLQICETKQSDAVANAIAKNAEFKQKAADAEANLAVANRLIAELQAQATQPKVDPQQVTDLEAKLARANQEVIRLQRSNSEIAGRLDAANAALKRLGAQPILPASTPTPVASPLNSPFHRALELGVKPGEDVRLLRRLLNLPDDSYNFDARVQTMWAAFEKDNPKLIASGKLIANGKVDEVELTYLNNLFRQYPDLFGVKKP